MPDTAVAKPQPPIIVLRNRLEAREGELKNALPSHIPPERFIRSLVTAASVNPEILACEFQSLWLACLRSAAAGLLPDGVESVILPFKGKAQWIPMYQGLLKQVRNSGQLKWITAGIVYEGEMYEHWIAQDGEHFRHVPSDDNEGKKIRRVYAIAMTKDGATYIEDMSLAEIMKHRNQSRATREDSPWEKWTSEMMKKTVLRRLSKLLPKSTDVDDLLQRDEDELHAKAPTNPAIERITDTADRLEAFGTAGDSTPVVELPDVPEGGSGEDQPASGELSPHDTAEHPVAMQDDPSAANPEDRAYQKGYEDRNRGIKRSAVPGEYRNNNRLALAWVQGWEDRVPKGKG